MKIFLSFLFLICGFQVQAITTEEATKQVTDLLNATEIAQKISYCVDGALDCRTHYFLKDKKTGELSKAFYVTFVSADRQTGTSGYFFPVAEKPGYYHRYEDSVFDGKKVITEIGDDGEIQLNDQGTLARIVNTRIPRLGTTRVIIADIIVTENQTVIEGIEYDTQDKSYSAKFSKPYNRINL